MYPCRRLLPQPLSRRELLARCLGGFGAVAMSALLAEQDGGKLLAAEDQQNPFAPKPPHFTAKATSVIFLYLDGGLSQVDSFDPKPRLTAENGKPFAVKIEPTQFNNNG